jgi:hypothetical protein
LLATLSTPKDLLGLTNSLIERIYSPGLNNAATLRLGLMLADKPGLDPTGLALASHEAALACSAVGAS